MGSKLTAEQATAILDSMMSFIGYQDPLDKSMSIEEAYVRLYANQLELMGFALDILEHATSDKHVLDRANSLKEAVSESAADALESADIYRSSVRKNTGIYYKLDKLCPKDSNWPVSISTLNRIGSFVPENIPLTNLLVARAKQKLSDIFKKHG